MTGRTRAGRRPRRHLFIFFLLYLPVCLGLLAVLLQLALNSPTAQAALQAALRRAIPGTIAYGRAELSFFPLRVHLYGVRLVHPDGRALITAREVSAAYAGSLRHPGRDGVALDDVTVVDGSLELLFDEQSNLSLLELFLSPEPEPEGAPAEPGGVPPRVSLQNVEVRNLRFLLHVSEAGLTIETEQGQVHGAFLLEDGEMTIDADVDLPRGRVRVTGGPDVAEPVVDIPVDGLSVRGFLWRGSGFSIREAELASQGVAARLSGGMYVFAEPVSWYGTTELTLPFEQWFLTPLLGGTIGGVAEVQGSFYGTLERARGAYLVRSSELRLPGVALTDVLLQGGLDGQQLDIARLEARLLGGQARLQGALRLLDGVVRGRLALERVATSSLLPPGPPRDVAAGALSGQVQGEASLWAEGPLEATAELDLALERRGVKGGLPLPSQLRLTARAKALGPRLELGGLTLRGGGHALAARGWLDLERRSFDLAAELATASLAPVLRPLGLPQSDARASFAGRLQGRFDDPRVRGQLAVEELTLYGLRFGRLDCGLALDGGMLSVSRLRSQGGWGRVELEGQLGLWQQSTARPHADPPLGLRGKLEDIELATFLPAAARGRGTASAELSARGTLDRLEAELFVRTDALEVYGLALEHFELSALLQRAGPKLQAKVPLLSLALLGGGGLKGSGELRSDRTFTVDLRAEGLPVAELDRLSGMNRGLSGRITFGVHGEGPLSAPRAAGDLLLHDLQVRNEDDEPLYTLGGASLHFELGEDQRLRVSSEAAFRHFDLQAELPLDLTAATPVALDRAFARLSFHELSLEEVVPGLADRGVKGRLTGEANLALPGGNPSFSLNISRLWLDVLGQQIGNVPAGGAPSEEAAAGQPLRFSFDGRRVRVEQLALQSSGRRLTLGGQVTLDEEGGPLASQLDLQASGELDLAVLRPFIPDLPRLSGSVQFDLALGGTPSEPELEGFLALERTSFQLVALNQELALERGRVVFLPGRIAIPDGSPLVGRLGRRGAFSLTAEVETTRLWPPLVPRARVTLRGERLRLAFPDAGLNLTLDVPVLKLAASDVLAPERRLEVSGEVRLAQGQLIRSYTDPEALAAAFRSWFEGMEQAQSRSLPQGHPARALSLRGLKITGEEGALAVQIQAAILSLGLHLRPDLVISGTLDGLRVTGVLETQEDDAITLMDREFRLTHSDIRFDGSTNPLVDLEAEAEVIAAPVGTSLGEQQDMAFSTANEEDRTYQITLYLEGRLPDDLEKFELSSPQTSDQRELWTLLLLGYRYSDLARSGQGGEVGSEVLLSSALQILSQKISEKALKEFQLVDQLQLLSQHQDVKVQVSKKVLGGKLELLGSGTFSGADTQGSLGAKLYLRERLFFEFSTTQGNERNPMSSRLGWQVPLD